MIILGFQIFNLKYYNFGSFESSVHIVQKLPGIDAIARDFNESFYQPLLICDTNTRHLADKMKGGAGVPVCMLESGEQHKNWQSVEKILRCASESGIGRDGIFIGIGGGVVTDLCAFAASIYMRGCSLVLVATTLLAMADAVIGGKTGFDLFGIKNLAGTFYPARHVYMPIESLANLPLAEWKSGMAEIIKTAVLAGGIDDDSFIDEIIAIADSYPESPLLSGIIGKTIELKGRIVEEDPRETGSSRMLLNLGHSFGHGLEAAAGLGKITHGEAVAWGIARSCDLGVLLGICPPLRAARIKAALSAYGYEIKAPHSLADSGSILKAIKADKKKRGGCIIFIVPGEKSAVPVAPDSEETIYKIINGEY